MSHYRYRGRSRARRARHRPAGSRRRGWRRNPTIEPRCHPARDRTRRRGRHHGPGALAAARRRTALDRGPGALLAADVLDHEIRPPPAARPAGPPRNRAHNTLLRDALYDVLESLRPGGISPRRSRAPSGHLPAAVREHGPGGRVDRHARRCFQRLGEYLAHDQDVQDRVKAALRYPLIVVAVIALAVTVITVFVIRISRRCSRCSATIFRGRHASSWAPRRSCTTTGSRW